MSFSKRLLSGAAPALVPGENFKVVTYTGNGGTQSITGVGFKPDLVWAKKRSGGDDNVWFDISGGDAPYDITFLPSSGISSTTKALLLIKLIP